MRENESDAMTKPSLKDFILPFGMIAGAACGLLAAIIDGSAARDPDGGDGGAMLAVALMIVGTIVGTAIGLIVTIIVYMRTRRRGSKA